MDTVFEKNLAALRAVNPLLADKIGSVEENILFDVFQGNHPAAINMVNTRTSTPLYDDPLQDTAKKMEELNPCRLYPFFYFFGIGNGVFIQELLTHETLQRIVIIEPELELLYIAFNLIDFAEPLSDGHLVLILSEDFDFPDALLLLDHPHAHLYVKLYRLEIPIPYYSGYYDELMRVNGCFLRAIEHLVVGHGNDSIDVLMGIEQHIQNIPLMLKNPKFQDLLQRKNSEVAVIVSTGPSLQKQLPLLKNIQDYVTIFSIDASTPILEKSGIHPDIITSLERLALTAKFHENTSAPFQEKAIFLLASLAHTELLSHIKAGTKVLTMRPYGYTRFFSLDDYGYAGIGMSAANFAYDIASQMKFKTIVLIGQDLAFGDDGTSHSSGHIFTNQELSFQESDIYLEKYGGGGTVRSRQVWKMFLNTLEEAINAKKETIQTVNATEGGARIRGALELPFHEVCDRIVNRSVPKNAIILPYPAEEEFRSNIKHARKKIHEWLRYGRRMQKKIEKLFLEVASACDDLVVKHQTGQLGNIDLSLFNALSLKISAIREEIDDPTFSLLFYDITRTAILHQELDLAKLKVTPAETEEEKMVATVDWVMQHRPWLFSLAGSINAELDIVKRAARRWQTACNLPDGISESDPE